MPVPVTSAMPMSSTMAPTSTSTTAPITRPPTTPTTGALPAPTTEPASTTTAPEAAAATATNRTRYRFRTIDDAKDPTFNQLLGINDHGRIVGYFGSGADAAHPNKGFRIVSPYRQGDFFDKNFPGSVQTQAVGVNDAATVAGFFVDGAGANIGFVAHGQHYTAIANPLTSKKAPFDQLLGINDHDIAVGFYNDDAGASHGYTVDVNSGDFRPVEVPVQADSVVATGIDDDGDVSGFLTTNGATSAFVIVGGRFQPLSFGNHTDTQALGLNDRHEVSGSYVGADGRTHGFVWSARAGLTRVDDPNTSTSTVVNGLNDNGQLVGFFTALDGTTHGFLANRLPTGFGEN
jgi:hypothetical protein